MISVLFTALIALTAPQQDQQQLEHWRLVEEIRIGTVQGPAALTMIHSVLVDPAGQRVYVANGFEHLIRVFSTQTGVLVGTIGRRGSGPGEFERLTRIGWKQDTLFAIDRSLSRVTMFKPDGTHVRTFNLSPPQLPNGTSPLPVSLTSTGGIVGRPNVPLSLVAAGTVSTNAIVLVTRDGRVIRTLGVYSVENTVQNVQFEGLAMQLMQPLSSAMLDDVAPDGSSILLADLSGARVTRLGPAGDTIYHKAFHYEPRPISRAFRDSIYDHFAGEIAKAAPGVSRARVRDAAERMFVFPANHPPLTEVVIGRDGSAWLRREPREDGSVVWVVLAPDGSVKANVRTSTALRIRAVEAESVWAEVLGQFDVPYLVRYRIVRQ